MRTTEEIRAAMEAEADKVRAARNMRDYGMAVKHTAKRNTLAWVLGIGEEG